MSYRWLLRPPPLRLPKAPASIASDYRTLYYYLPSKTMNDGRAPVTQLNTTTLETRGAIEILTLNRPDQLNAVTPDMIGELTDYFSALHDRPTTRVVILRGNGPEFSAGGCDMGSGDLLPRLVGLSVTSELLLTGRFLKAQRAKAIGLVSDIVPADELLAKGMEFASEMLRVSPMGLRLTKQALNVLIDAPSLEAALMMEDRQQVILLETHDHAEAVAAFRERRDPSYSDQ